MSITFGANVTTTGEYEVRCGCTYFDQETMPAQGRFPSYVDASAWLASYMDAPYPLPGCTDEMCLAYAPSLLSVSALVDVPAGVNMCNGNAADVLIALGLVDAETGEAIFCGTRSGVDFEGRVLLALALEPVSAGRAPLIERAEGGMLAVEGGREEGYVQDRLSQLLPIAAYAREHELDVAWA